MILARMKHEASVTATLYTSLQVVLIRPENLNCTFKFIFK
jgi:hypothetical protein